MLKGGDSLRENILKTIYYGLNPPSEVSTEISKKYKKDYDEIEKQIQILKDSFTESKKFTKEQENQIYKIFDMQIDTQIEASVSNAEEKFEQGFNMGFKLAMEVLKK